MGSFFPAESKLILVSLQGHSNLFVKAGVAKVLWQ